MARLVIVALLHNVSLTCRLLLTITADKSMYCFGGYDGSYRNDFHEFNFGAYAILN